MNRQNKEIQRAKENLISRLAKILDLNRDKKIVVVGTTCAGKSTFVKSIEGVRDMDSLLFPQLSQEEKDYVCSNPWTEEIGRTMVKLARERVKVEPGKPVFGTVVLDSDLIIELKISDDLLRERSASRGVNFDDAKNMQKQIESEIKQSGIRAIVFDVG